MPEALENEIRTLRAHFWSERDPDGHAFAPLADAYLRKGDLDEALALVEDGLGRLPEFTTGHLVAARVHRARGDGEGLRAALDRLLGLDPGNVAGLRLQGEVLEEEGRSGEALEAFRTAHEGNPEYDDLESRIARLALPDPMGGPGSWEGAERGEASPGADPFAGSAVGGLEGNEPDAGTGESWPDVAWPEIEEASAAGDAEPIAEDAGDALENVFSLENEFLDPSGALELDRGDLAPGGDGLDPSDLSQDAEVASDSDAGSGEDPFDLAWDSDLGWEVEPESDEGAGTPEGREKGDRDPEGEIAELVSGAEGGGEAPDAPDALPEAAPDTTSREEEVREPEARDSAPLAEASPTVTRTLAELYLKQGLTGRAVETFEALVDRRPDDEELAGRLAEVRALLGMGPTPTGAELTPGPVEPGAEPAPERAEPPATEPESETDPEPAERAPQWAGAEVGEDGEEAPTPFAWDPTPPDPEPRDGEEATAEATAGSARSIGQYMRDLLAWEPGAVPIESLDPAAVPIGSLAPDPSEGEGGDSDAKPEATGDLDEFQSWLKGLRS